MVFSPLTSTSYHRSISSVGEGQLRRDGQSGRMFSLQQPEVANEEANSTSIQQPAMAEPSQTQSQNSLEKWLRLMGAARQMAYEDEQRAPLRRDADSMRYRLQRTYFDQERQVTPRSPLASDQRLMAYRAAEGDDNSTRVIDFIA